ncbi:MAG: hypothetical protein ICV56_01590 [Nitrososphaeraceae archaeon]|nr:hypothetical protein [Nitrososphaeraceae archaeon]
MTHIEDIAVAVPAKRNKSDFHKMKSATILSNKKFDVLDVLTTACLKN